MWKKIRIGILLFVLVLVAGDAFLSHFRALSWEDTLWVAIYPVNPDHDPEVAKYIGGLEDRDFSGIETFFGDEAQRTKLPLSQPFKVLLAHPVADIPPTAPRDGNAIQIAWWSLRLRWWAFRHDHADFAPHIRMFVLYHNYRRITELEHSLGLEKGMIGVVHAYAHREMQGKNNLVIAHEMLHTIGATDKYDLHNLQPVYPDGYAEPGKRPLYPQRYAELMAGRIPESESSSEMPRSLRLVELGDRTLQEIRWRP
jgi:hypothetical protein